MLSPSMRRGLAAGGALLVLGGSAVGIASAQTQPANPTPPGQPGRNNGNNGYQAFIDALAKRLGITSDALQTAIGQARADAGLPTGPAGRGLPFGPGPGGRPGGPRGFAFLDLNTAAQAIGIPPAQLRIELRGKSLSDVAAAHQKAPGDVATALKNAAHARIDQAVTANRLTADQANQQKTQVDQRIDQLMTQVMPQPGQRRGADQQPVI
jgi:hypothetical protein